MRKCVVCGTTEGKIYTSNNKYGMVLCNKHYCQMQYCGKFLERSMFEPNEFIINGDTMEIVLYNRKHVEVGRTITDAKYYNVVKEWKWILSARGYARGQKCNAQIFLHRLITNTPGGMVVDHVNHDTLDNRECNLRICTIQENARNHVVNSNNSTGYTGVRRNKNKDKWEARIQVGNKYIHLGTFINKEDAIAARKEAEIKYFGDFRYKEAQ